MSDDMKMIVLPGREEILQRLLEVSDDPATEERFYPLILEYAGQRRAGASVDRK